MKCPVCGIAYGNGGGCPFCGAKPNGPACADEAAEPAKTEAPPGGLIRDENGVYHWVYEVNLYKNPVILFTVWKIVVLCALFPGLLLFFLELGGGFVTALLLFGKISLLVAAICTVLLFIAYYLIVAPINGGRYCAVFVMDARGVKHIQMQKQFKKIKSSLLSAFLPVFWRETPAPLGNLLAGAKRSTYSHFPDVKKIIALERRRTIKIVTGDMVHNQIYAEEGDYPYVLAHIRQHSPKNAVFKER